MCWPALFAITRYHAVDWCLKQLIPDSLGGWMFSLRSGRVFLHEGCICVSGAHSWMCGCSCLQNSLYDFPSSCLETGTWNLLLELGCLVIKNFSFWCPSHSDMTTDTSACLAFYVGAGDLNLVPNACTILVAGVLARAFFALFIWLWGGFFVYVFTWSFLRKAQAASDLEMERERKVRTKERGGRQ